MTLVVSHNFIAAHCANSVSTEAGDCVASEVLSVHCSLMETGTGWESSRTGQSPRFCPGGEGVRMSAMLLYYRGC